MNEITPDEIRRRLYVSLPIDLEDAKKILSDPNVLYSKKLLEERERRLDANMMAILKGEPVPYPISDKLLAEMLDDTICSECGQTIDND